MIPTLKVEAPFARKTDIKEDIAPLRVSVRRAQSPRLVAR